MKHSLTSQLKSLMLGGAALALSAGATSSANAAAVSSTSESPLDQRVARVRQAIENQVNGGLEQDTSKERGGPGTLWWRNGWGNGGFHRRWGNGGGWGNGWRNGGPWANIRL